VGERNAERRHVARTACLGKMGRNQFKRESGSS
jgi:hypothetical protein